MQVDAQTIHPIALSVSRGLVRVAEMRDEWFDPTPEPQELLQTVARGNVAADVLSFIQRLPDTTPNYPYYYEWDNIAALPISTYEDWFSRQIPKSTRTHLRKAAKSGLQVRITPFDENLLQGISDIYNETPTRQGKRFKHYGKSLRELKASHETFLSSSDFIGAYLDSELVGFIKLVHCGGSARTMQIMSKISHRAKCPNNALIAKAVEICADRGIPYLVYGRYEYPGKGADGLQEFKKENGFLKTLYPRYYVPLNLRGRLGLRFGLIHGVKPLLPSRVVALFRQIRSGLQPTTARLQSHSSIPT